MLTATHTLRLHDTYNRVAHLDLAFPNPPDDPLSRLILLEHQANFDLWHEEDKARTPAPAPALIVEVKKAIDRLNQLRNDYVEQIDTLLLTLASPQNESAPLHSETPGLMIDRLSILSLKVFHTAEEAARSSATPEHRERNEARLAILEQQREDLAACLDQLWTQVTHGERRFKLYRQMKMYNDPDLNPVLYNRQARRP